MRRIMDSRRALTVLVAVVAVLAAGIPSAASAKKPQEPPLVGELATFAAPTCASGCGSGSTVGPGGALYVTEGAAGRISRVDPKTGDDHDVRQRSAEVDPRPSAAADRRRVHRRDRLRAGHPRRPRRRRQRRRRHLPGGRPEQLHRRRGHRRVRLEPIRRALPFDHPDRSPVRAGDLPRRVPGHRRAPQPGAAGHPRRRGQRADRVRQHRPDRAGGTRATRSTWPRPAPSPTCPRTARWWRSGRSRRTATEVASGARLLVDVEFGRGRTLYALSQGVFGGGPRGFSGAAEHRRAREGQRERHLHRRRRRPGPADLARVHREHRLRRHAHGQGDQGRQRAKAAVRQVALSSSHEAGARCKSRPGRHTARPRRRAVSRRDPWAAPGSNRRPPACKAAPTETTIGDDRLEWPASDDTLRRTRAAAPRW